MTPHLRHLTAAALLACASALHAATATIQFASGDYETTELSYGLGLPFLTTPRETVWNKDDLKVTVVGGTAELGKDFSFEPIGWLSPAEGETAPRLGSRISVMDDGLPEGDETVVLELSLSKPVEGLAIGPVSRTTITIHNSPPTVELVSGTVTEWNNADDHQPNQLWLFRRGDADVAFTVEFAEGSGGTATPGKDFLVPSAVSFAPGETEKSVPITILDDGECEVNEIISLALRCSNPAVVLQPALLSLEDNEIPPSIDFSIRSDTLPPGWGWARSTSRLPDDGFIALASDAYGSSNRLARYDRFGRLVRTYPPFQLTEAYDLRADQEGTILKTTDVLPDGGFLVSGVFGAVNGETRPGLARFNSDGTLDLGFLPLGEKPVVSPPREIPGIRVLTVMRDGRIVVQHGPEHRLFRLLSNGAIDPTFDASSLKGTVMINASEQLPNRLLVVLAFAQDPQSVQFDDLRVRRLLPDGTIDLSFEPAYEKPAAFQFGLDGSLFNIQQERGILVLPDGKIIIRAVLEPTPENPNRRGLFRLNPDGDLDPSFDAKMDGDPFGVFPNGDIVVWEGRRWGYQDLRVIDPTGKLRPGVQRARPTFCGASGQPHYKLITSEIVAWGSANMPINEVLSPVALRLGENPQSGFRLFGATGAEFCVGNFGELLDPWHAVTHPGIGNIEVEVRRLGVTTIPASVRYRTRDGSARAGQHFVAVEGRLDFTPLEIRKRLTLRTLGGEATSREFELELTDAIGGEILGPPLRVTILGRSSGFPTGAIETLSDGTRRVTADIVYPEPVSDLSNTVLQRWDLETSADLLRWTPVSKLGWRPSFIGPRPEGLPVGDGRRQHLRAIWLDVSATNAPTRYYRAVAR